MIKVKAIWQNRTPHGFTLIELVLVIAILGILAVVALPTLFGTTLTAARTNTANMTAAAIQEGVHVYMTDQVARGLPKTYPATLDAVADTTWGSIANPLFVTVLETGITSGWHKKAAACYVYDSNGNGVVDAAGTDTYYGYTAGTGAFVLDAGGC